MKPTPVLLHGESHRQRSPAGYSSWGHKESDMTEMTNTFTFRAFWLLWQCSDLCCKMVQQKWWTLLLSSTWCLWRQRFPGRGTGERCRESLPHAVLIPGSRVRSSTYLWSRQGKRETVVMRGASQSLCLEVAKVEVPSFVKGATSLKRSVLELGVYVRIHRLVTETC